jgi:phosphoketolase
MITRFQEILNESKKTYEFKIGIAGDLPEGCEESIKSCLEKYSVASMSKGKKTPIQERPLDFPQLKNMEVTYYEVELNYPSTQQVLQEYIGQCCRIDQAYIIVRNPEEMQEKYQEMPEDTVYTTKLTQEDMGGESAQADAGNNRVMDLLKELEVARKEREHDPSAAAPEAN